MNSTSTTSSTPKNPLESLPDKIKALILEFVTLKDYANTAMASQEFNALLDDQSALWAKYICEDFMNDTCSEAPASFKEQFPTNKELKEGQVSTSSMVRAKEQIISHYQTKGRFKAFLEQYFDAKTTNTFLDDMMKLFKDPPFPSPVYKKEAQSFPTNTVFQNFLTEIHFGIQGKTLFQSARQKVAVELVKRIEEQLVKRDVDTKELARLRWYLYDKQEEEQEEEEKVSKAKEGLLQKRLAREKTSEHLAFQPNYSAGEPLQSTTTSTQTNTAYQITAFEELYYIIYAWIENYCAMICDYLTALKNPYLLLSEYSRLWNKFALITIELDHIFQPYAQLFGKLYEDKCRHLPNFPEFSMWRLAIKIWMDEVQDAFGYYLNESFRYVVKKTRGEEKLIEYNLKNTTDKNQTDDLPEEDSGFKDEYNLNKQKLKKILKGYYDAMDDLSHNEFSIFYWDCDNEAKTEPKVSLDSLIIQDTQSYYEECRKVVKYNPNYFKKLLKNDYELVGDIFGELFNLEVKKLQTSTIKELLYKEFTAAILEVENKEKENALKTSDGKASTTTVPEANNTNNVVNLEQILKLLKAEGVVIDNNYFTSEKREKIAAVLSRDHQSFNAYLYHLMEGQKDVENQNKEIEDKKYFRYIRGFTLTDPRFKSFFELGRVPSFVEVHQPGLQRLNTREELEDKGDRFEFV